MKILEKEFPDLLGLNSEIDVSEEKEKTIRIQATAGQIQDLREMDLDIDVMFKSYISGFFYREIGMEISEKILLGLKKEDIEHLFSFLNLKAKTRNPGKYILTNVQVGSLISDYPGFKPCSSDKINHSFSPYLIGEMGEIQVYIDPHIEWDNNVIGWFSNDFWNYEIISFQNSESFFELKYKIKIEDPQSEVYELINVL